MLKDHSKRIMRDIITLKLHYLYILEYDHMIFTIVIQT